MERTVAIVLITFHSERYLPRCIEGIRRQSHPFNLVAVDNASSDSSADIVASAFPSACVIRNSTNLGFSAAANQAIAASTTDYVLLLNPDVFLTPDYVSRLVEALEERGTRYGAATGKLLRARGEAIEPTTVVDSKGIRMTRSGRHFDIASNEPDVADAAAEVFGVSGAAAMYRREFLNDVATEGEVFDEDFFAYREDADLAWRGRLRGWQSVYVPDAVAYHVRRVTPEVRAKLPADINMHSVKNRFLLRIKNEGAYLALRNAPFELLRDALVLGAALTVERSSMPALRWLWHHRRRILEKRRAVQSRRTVPDRDLARWFGW